jgi:molybdenum cofactor guanylyltransferase
MNALLRTLLRPCPGAPSGAELPSWLRRAMSEEMRPLGLVLAGGRARRMGGGDKTQIRIAGESILERIAKRLQPQCRALLLSVARPALNPRSGFVPVIDEIADGGPLAGVLAGLDWAAANMPDAATLVTVSGDCPFIPADLVERLEEARRDEHKPLACARSGNWTHPVIGLWPVDLRHELRHALAAEKLRKVDTWTARRGVAIAEWPIEPIDPFFNVNTPEDAAKAEALAKAAANG